MSSQRREVMKQRAIRLIRHRRLLLAGVAVLALALPMAAWSGGGPSSLLKAAPASATAQDTIQYVQTTGSSGTYIQYVPGDGTTSTNQSVTGGGGCATPTPSGVPLLAFSGFSYDSSYSPASRTPAVVGAYKQRTGVCSIPPAWAIDNVLSGPQMGAEALDFSVGANSLVKDRVFTRATLYLQRSDKLAGSVTVELLESLKGSPAGSQCYGLADTSTKQVDTTTPDTTVACPSQVNPPTPFDTVEVRVLTNGGSVSVVGPSSTFYLAGQICPGQPAIHTTSGQDPTFGQVKVDVVLGPSATVCKSYTTFSAQQTVTGGGTSVSKNVVFNSFGAGGTDLNFTIDWGNFPFCTPDGTTPPVCAPTTVSLDGVTYTNQTYCAAATAGQPLCTTSKNFQYVTVNSVTLTNLIETWDGKIDPWWAR